MTDKIHTGNSILTLTLADLTVSKKYRREIYLPVFIHLYILFSFMKVFETWYICLVARK